MKLTNLRKIFLYVLALAVLLGIWFPEPGRTQGEQTRFFKVTGHTVSGPFLDFFDKNGKEEIFGYPITEAFMDQGIRVQYFQKARMEWHPENPDPFKVQLGLLGDELNYRYPPVAPPRTLSRRQYYSQETGHLVSYAFLDYFKAHGGVDLFGHPISEMRLEDDRIVQYFQRLKMEWYPEDRTNPVHIGNLGQFYIEKHPERIPQEAYNVSAIPQTGPSTATPIGISSIRAVVSLRYSVMGKQRDQTVSVLVTDNNGTPVPNATVDIQFTNSKGDRLSISHQLTTDERGFVRESIPVSGGRTGEQVIVEANVTYGTLKTSAQNVFLLWW